jgi:predicted MFS family arabinose efflux permease
MIMTNTVPAEKHVFTKYQAFVIAILAIIQFTVVLDFMVISPLGAILMEELKIIPSQFGLVVSVYAFSAGASGLLAAGFADRFDRKKFLLFFYSGFVLGTLLCGMATNYHFLLAARVVTGIFGGVISSIGFAIITDIFKMEVRGRVMGFVQMSFAASQILGLPIGLYLANKFGWHSPFMMIVGFSVMVVLVIFFYLKPIEGHLQLQSEKTPFQHLISTLSHSDYVLAFVATTMLATGGFMLMPFGSAFAIHNLELKMDDLPVLYGITGVFSIIFGPLIGKASDKIGKYNMFVVGSILSSLMVLIYTTLDATPLYVVVILNVILFVGISSRMISSSALVSGIPAAKDRGAFMSINSSVQQISGGIASALAGMIVVQSDTGKLLRYPLLGYVVVGSVAFTVFMLYLINRDVKKKLHAAQP